MIIAGIGSRETPQNILTEMTKIGEWIKENRFTCRSGHASGADWAFEQGAQERCICYLPSQNFNNSFTSKSYKIVPKTDERFDEITNRFHPNPFAIRGYVRQLMNRNICQVLGLNLDKHTDFIVCWTRDGKDTGGTGQAIRIAIHYKIPILNMFYEEFNTSEKVIKYLKTFVK